MDSMQQQTKQPTDTAAAANAVPVEPRRFAFPAAMGEHHMRPATAEDDNPCDVLSPRNGGIGASAGDGGGMFGVHHTRTPSRSTGVPPMMVVRTGGRGPGAAPGPAPAPIVPIFSDPADVARRNNRLQRQRALWCATVESAKDLADEVEKESLETGGPMPDILLHVLVQSNPDGMYDRRNPLHIATLWRLLVQAGVGRDPNHNGNGHTLGDKFRDLVGQSKGMIREVQSVCTDRNSLAEVGGRIKNLATYVNLPSPTTRGIGAFVKEMMGGDSDDRDRRRTSDVSTISGPFQDTPSTAAVATALSEAEIEMSRMLLKNQLDARAKISGIIPWESFIANYVDIGSVFYFQVLYEQFWNKCSDEEDDLSFSGLPNFLALIENNDTSYVSEFLQTKACTGNDPPHNRDNIPGKRKAVAAAWTRGAKAMATKIKDAVAAKIVELNGAGETLVFADLDGIVTALFAEATGFNQIADRERRYLCRQLFAIHLDHVENED